MTQDPPSRSGTMSVVYFSQRIVSFSLEQPRVEGSWYVVKPRHPGWEPICAGRLIFANDRIQTWEIRTKELKADRRAHAKGINAVAVSSDGNHVASVSNDLTARVWDMRGNEVGKYVGDVGLADVKFFPDHHLVLACLDNTVKIVHWRTGSLVETFSGHAHPCEAVDVLPLSRKIVSASGDRTLKIWSGKTIVKDNPPETNIGYSVGRTLTGHEVMSGTHAHYYVLTISGPCLGSERGGKRRLGNQRLRG